MESWEKPWCYFKDDFCSYRIQTMIFSIGCSDKIKSYINYNSIIFDTSAIVVQYQVDWQQMPNEEELYQDYQLLEDHNYIM